MEYEALNALAVNDRSVAAPVTLKVTSNALVALISPDRLVYTFCAAPEEVIVVEPSTLFWEASEYDPGHAGSVSMKDWLKGVKPEAEKEGVCTSPPLTAIVPEMNLFWLVYVIPADTQMGMRLPHRAAMATVRQRVIGSPFPARRTRPKTPATLP